MPVPVNEAMSVVVLSAGETPPDQFDPVEKVEPLVEFHVIVLAVAVSADLSKTTRAIKIRFMAAVGLLGGGVSGRRRRTMNGGREEGWQFFRRGKRGFASGGLPFGGGFGLWGQRTRMRWSAGGSPGRRNFLPRKGAKDRG